MFDAHLRRVIDPWLLPLARRLAGAGVSANAVTGLAFAAGLGSAGAVAAGHFGWALVLLALGRLGDGLDGLVAAVTRRTDLGGYLDIVGDFVFYGAVPLAFALHDPGVNAVPAAVLLTSFYVNGASFLAYAAVAARRGMGEEARGPKSIYFTAGLAEGGETILAFAVAMAWPGLFPAMCWVFSALCAVTAASRVLLAWRRFR